MINVFMLNKSISFNRCLIKMFATLIDNRKLDLSGARDLLTLQTELRNDDSFILINTAITFKLHPVYNFNLSALYQLHCVTLSKLTKCYK